MVSGVMIFIGLNRCPVTGGGSVYPKFWSVAVLTVVIRLVLLKGKSSIVLSLVWGILSWQESWLRLGLLVMSALR